MTFWIPKEEARRNRQAKEDQNYILVNFWCPLTDSLERTPFPPKFKMLNIDSYNGTKDLIYYTTILPAPNEATKRIGALQIHLDHIKRLGQTLVH